MQSRCVFLVFVVACAADSGGGSAPGPKVPNNPVACPTTGRYMSLRPGRAWTYEVTKPTGTQKKTQQVGSLEDIGGDKAGVQAFRVTTTKTGGTVVSWQEDTGTSIRRHREQDMSGISMTDEYYLPFHTRIDERVDYISGGAQWTETYDELATDVVTEQMSRVTKTDMWKVEATDAQIAVPAGDYCTMRVSRTTIVTGQPGALKTYWFARGVGKVREATSTAVEELASFTP